MQPAGEITIAATFNGPPASGNGGYAAGLLAGYDTGPRTVRVLAPIPLGTPLSVSRAGDVTEARHGDKRILAARPGTAALTPPPAPSLAAARDAATRPTSFGAGGASTCFVCGRNRAPGEGLDEQGRSVRIGQVGQSVRTTLTLDAGEPFVRVTVELDHRVRDHRLRAHFPLPRRTDHSVAECAFAQVRRRFDLMG
jgi:hypothetical protein